MPQPKRAPAKGAETPPVHDTARAGDGNAYGLLLTRKGVPLTPHTVLFALDGRLVALPGLYRCDRPTPVGGPGECPLEQAIAASRQRGCGVSLVEVAVGDLEQLRAAHRADLDAARGVTAGMARDARRGELDGGEAERVTDELAALGQKEN